MEGESMSARARTAKKGPGVLLERNQEVYKTRLWDKQRGGVRVEWGGGERVLRQEQQMGL